MRKYYIAILGVFALFFALGNENASANEGKANKSIISYGGWVYYSHYDEKLARTSFYREKFDGSRKQKLINYNENAWNFQVENGHIYYKKKDGLYRMSLHGENKKMMDLDPSLNKYYHYQIKGKWLYHFENISNWDPDATMAPDVYHVYRTDLVTKQTNLLDVKLKAPQNSSQYKVITQNGIYAIYDYLPWIEFIPTNSKKPQIVDFGGKLRTGNILADRGNIYFTRIQASTKKLFLVKYNEDTQNTKVISEIPKVYGAYLTLDNMYGGYAYFSIDFTNKPISRVYRVPLTGGKVEKVIDLPKHYYYSIIGGKLL
jgi:hypothetical protein